MGLRVTVRLFPDIVPCSVNEFVYLLCHCDLVLFFELMYLFLSSVNWHCQTALPKSQRFLHALETFGPHLF